jgi:hypothetical protein
MRSLFKEKPRPGLLPVFLVILASAAAAAAGCGSDGSSQPDGHVDPTPDPDAIDMPDEAAPEEAAQEDAEDAAEAEDALEEDPAEDEIVRPPCDPMTDHNCITVRIGEREFIRTFADYESMEFNDEGTMMTVIRLWQLIDEEITPEPDQQRYKIYGTDGYTFSDYLYWENFLGGYIELGTRRVVFDPAQELPRLYRVKDAYLIVAFPL